MAVLSGRQPHRGAGMEGAGHHTVTYLGARRAEGTHNIWAGNVDHYHWHPLLGVTWGPSWGPFPPMAAEIFQMTFIRRTNLLKDDSIFLASTSLPSLGLGCWSYSSSSASHGKSPFSTRTGVDLAFLQSSNLVGREGRPRL